MPAGNVESFFASIEGGANAVYLGLQCFNARNRAGNFTPWQVLSMVKIAHSKQIKVYITLNTVIRNFDIPKLLDTLYQIKQINPDGVITQDIGVAFIAKRYFPEIKLHASTQMAIHNSVGVNYMAKQGFKRAVLARELTFGELVSISSKSKIELEIFIHGALCYSFSGMCLFSSFLGGASANRGLCTQPCRRIYVQNKQRRYCFSLKDNQQVENISKFAALGISSLKVEGRMKSSDYVLRVANAYRKALDGGDIDEAKTLLSEDLGREKTGYFMMRDVKNAVTQSASSGLLLGNVISVANGEISFSTNQKLSSGCRLRFRNPHNDKQIDAKVESLNYNDGVAVFKDVALEVKQGYEVYLTGSRLKLPSKINTDGVKIQEHLPQEKARRIINSLKLKTSSSQRGLYLRIDSLEWMNLVPFGKIDGLILQLTPSEWEKFDVNSDIIKKNKSKIFPEMPKFIAEGSIDFYRKMSQRLYNQKFNRFFVSHLSQIDILPEGATVSTNENVYLFNDAAVCCVKSHGVSNYIYPLENDIANLAKGTDKGGIIPIYFKPALFYSRMPVNNIANEVIFSDVAGAKYTKTVKNGITVVLPENQVSLTQYREKIDRFGFSKYLIDFSFVQPEKQTLAAVFEAFAKSEAVKPSSIFNFKRELK